MIVKELSSKIENLTTEIGEIKTVLGENKSEINSMFTSFSDILAERFEELNDNIKSSGGKVVSDADTSGVVDDLKSLIESFFNQVPTKEGGPSPDVSKITSDVSEVKESVEMLKDAMNYVTDSIGKLSKQIEQAPVATGTSPAPAVVSAGGDPGMEKVIYKGALRPPPATKIKTKIEPAIRPDIARIYSGAIKTKGKSASKATTAPAYSDTKTIKVESTPSVSTDKVPDRVFQLLESIKGKINDNVGVLVNSMENIRDEIVKIYKFHPALYELGTFARKLKKYPALEKLDPDLSNLLIDKINEWKKRLVF